MGSKMHRNRLAICVLMSLVIWISLVTMSHARTYPHIVAFGDSLTDHHGLQYYLEPYVGLYDPVTNPDGVLEVWSNGDVWVEYLADDWDATLENNAIAGAMTRGHENGTVQDYVDSGLLPPLGLVGQVDRYVDADPAFEPDSTLFTIWIGANDILEFDKGDTEYPDISSLVESAMHRITNSVIQLHDAGAANFLILNLPDIGRTPEYLDTPEAAALVTGYVQAYNDALIDVIADLEGQLPDITIYTFDMFQYLMELIQGGAFVNVTGTYMELDEDNVNGDAADYLFWDSIHPTTRAHGMFAESVSDTLFPEGDADDDDFCFIRTIGDDVGAMPSVAAGGALIALFLVMMVQMGRRFSAGRQ